MAIDSIHTLLAILRRSHVLADDQLDQVAREVVPIYSDVQSLGEYLVEIDWLTTYQLQLLLGGHWDQLTIGSYQILDRIGEGGVSEVFKAWDTIRGRVVALKVLRQDLATKADVVKQFQQEGQAITRLSHPNIIKTFDANEENGVYYFAMEFVEGMDLARYIEKTGPLAVEMACDLIRQTAQGLQHAHQFGLVHRDIKPANLFLLHPPMLVAQGAAKRRPDPVVKIIDWGLARCDRDEEDPKEGDATANGALVGTVDYIAPEQARNSALVDIRADIYSLGCTLYYLLASQPPFPGSSLMVRLQRHQEEPPPSLRAMRLDVPEELDAVVQKMLAKAPEDRFQIPLLLVPLLRKFSSQGVNGPRLGGSSNGGPGSSAILKRPGSALNISAPGAAGSGQHRALPRPSTPALLPRPGTSPHLPRPGDNGHAANGKR